MEHTNRRTFLKQAAMGAAGLGTAGLTSRRTWGESPVGFTRVVYRDLGSTGFRVSEIGFGAMNMRDPELVRKAIDSGIN